MKLHEFFDKPEKWCKDKAARDKDGHYTFPTSPNAVSWCLQGAWLRLRKLDSGTYQDYSPLVRPLEFTSINELCKWNNSPDLTFEEFHRKLVEADV